MTGRAGRAGSRHLLQWPVILWLTLVWTALWGDLSALVVLSGVLVAVAVCVLFPLPRVRAEVSVHPVAAVVLVAHFLVDVVVASAQVVAVTLRREAPRGALVRIDLVSESDLVLTVVAELVSLVPGSVVVETRRSTHSLFVHVLDAPDTDSTARARASVLEQEQRVLRAFTPQDRHGPPPPAETTTEQEAPP